MSELSINQKTELVYYVGKWLIETGAPVQVRKWLGTTLILGAPGGEIIVPYRKSELEDMERVRKKLLRKLRKYYKDLITWEMIAGR